jgi:hypothetical protein
MKGAADMMMAILLVIMMALFLSSYIYMLNTDQGKTAELNLREAEIQKLANTYNLLNKSLGMTWYISTVQSVFNASDQSLLCGADVKDDALPEKYFYRYDPTKPKKIKDAQQFILDRDSGAEDYKYNDFQPRLCYPTRKDAVDLIALDFADYLGIRKRIDINGIALEIKPDIENTIGFNSNGVESKTNQNILLTTSNGKIEETTTNSVTMTTEFPKMVDFSNYLVYYFAKLSDDFTDESVSGTADSSYDRRLRMQDLNVDKNTNLEKVCQMSICDAPVGSDTGSDVYMARIKKDAIETPLNILKLGTGLTKSSLNTVGKLELLTAARNNAPAFNKNDMRDAGGMMLHYTYTITPAEGTLTGSAATCDFETRDRYMSMLQDAVKAQTWTFGDVSYSEDDIIAFISGTIQQESAWNSEAVSACGAAGLGQFMPGTAREYGMTYVPNYNQINEYCGSNRLTECRNNIFNCDQADDRFDTTKNINGMARYIHFLLNRVIVTQHYTQDGYEALRLTAVSYNGGPGSLDRAVANANTYLGGFALDNVKFDDIAAYLLPETQNYVPRVMGYYMCYGGSLSGSGNYYYHNAKTNNFVKKAISLTTKAEDYLPAIDCTDVPYDDAPGLSRPAKDFFNAARFFAWRHNPITSNVAVYEDGTPDQFQMLFGDLACCGGKLWGCSAGIDGVTEIPVNALIDDRACLESLTRSVGSENNPVWVSKIYCTNAGFVVTQGAGEAPAPGSMPGPEAYAQCTQCTAYHYNWCTTTAAAGTDDYLGTCIAATTCPDGYPARIDKNYDCIPVSLSSGIQ